MKMLSFCGNRCDVCPRFMAARDGDEEKLNAAAVLWKKVGWRDCLATADEIACNGCGSAAWCRHGIKSCATGKGILHCGLCGGYPCERIQPAFDRTDGYAEICRRICSPAEYAIFKEAFFEKKRNRNRR
jgi:hypothetical protein